MRDDFASVARPVKELIGFARVALEPAEAKRLSFTVHPSRLAFHGADMALATEPGKFTFWVGGSGSDVRTEASMQLDGGRTEYDRRKIVAVTNATS